MHPLTFSLLAFSVTLLVVPRVRAFATKRGIVDRPDADRKLHARTTPLCGGLAIFAGLMISIAAAIVVRRYVGLDLPREDVLGLLLPLSLASMVIVIVGLLDDMLPMRGRQKLFGQLLAVAVVLLGGMRIEQVTMLGVHLEFGTFSVVVTGLWLLLCINALNLLDGADGFAGSIGVVICITLTAIAMHRGSHVEVLVAAVMTGALLAFLVFNMPPSKMFLGDAGSMLIGLVVGTLAIYGNVKSAASIAMATPLAIMALPILDTSAAIVRRLLTGRGLAIGDRAHIHHSMIRNGFGPRRLVAAAVLLCAIPAVGAYLSVRNNQPFYAWFGLASLIGLLVGLRIFGRNELKLLSSRAMSFSNSIVPVRLGRSRTVGNVRANLAPQRRMGLKNSRHLSRLWRALSKFADDHHLRRVVLHLTGSWMDEGDDVLWERGLPQSSLENWRTSVPLCSQGRTFGRIDMSASIMGNSGQKILGPLSELLDTLDPTIHTLYDEVASRSLALQTGYSNRVLFINRSYWPDCEATGQLLTELCEDLASEFAVSVLAGQPNHVADGQSFRPVGVQRRNDVEINRVRHSTFSKRSMLGKALNLISYMIAATWQAFVLPKHEIVVVETDPFLLAILGGLLKRFRGSRLIIYLQDVYPDVALEIGKVKEGIITRVVRHLLMRAYASADRIVVLGDDMKKRIIDHGVAPGKIRCIPNWIDTETVFPIKHDNAFRREHGLDDKFIVMHSGNMGLTQQLDELLLVAEGLRHREDIVFAFVGHGAARPLLEEIVARKELSNVRFFPYQPREHLAMSLSAADLHIVAMHPDISGCLVPSKVYGILASGTPVLAIVPPQTDVGQLVETESVGISVAPGDLVTIQQAILQFANGTVDLDGMSVRARKLAEDRFDRSHSVAAFTDLLDDFMPRRRDEQKRVTRSEWRAARSETETSDEMRVARSETETSDEMRVARSETGVGSE